MHFFKWKICRRKNELTGKMFYFISREAGGKIFVTILNVFNYFSFTHKYRVVVNLTITKQHSAGEKKQHVCAKISIQAKKCCFFFIKIIF